MKTPFDHSVILFGGTSEERLVSVASAQNLSAQVPEARLLFIGKNNEVYETTAKDLALHENPFMKDFVPQAGPLFDSLSKAIPFLKDKKVILALHGTEGEDGTLQKLFEDHQVFYTGSQSKASAMAFDKHLTKKIAKSHGLPVAEDLNIKVFSDSEVEALREFQERHRKIVLKPLANGSSMGLYIVSSLDELDEAITDIKSKNLNHYLAEVFLTGRELTVGVWEKEPGVLFPLPCSEVKVIQGRQFDYQGKYLGNGVQELTPAPITSEEAKVCQEMALKIHQVLDCRGYTRTDMILTEKGPILLEINTLPGLSKASFIPQQLAAVGVSLRDFFEKQLR